MVMAGSYELLYVCRDCILETMECSKAAHMQPTCPLCRADVSPTDLRRGVNEAVHSYDADPVVASLQACVADSKLNVLLDEVLPASLPKTVRSSVARFADSG